ncbi:MULTISPECIES: magnesium transporter protection protein MgtU [Pantoea]|jgi:hypothetical protein|uniref:Magnesium transporter protection protein MgtU n=1 Tax=Pantoea brenneri TaxID=472694 RepID=A0ABU9MIR0_9GAMM|nr:MULTISPECIES: magnesium transporter protection protein MgtU [Pantoea]MDH1088721.1 magnesium transporter protection protein MgtU [Pantoea brenneri]MDH2124010.1 magnesium transporter protection protein MgtU [Pantoea brenneri]MDU4129753.1 magnesium transporter protection protein MgtU [Pantoea sp.]MDU4748528.1 magnesium transporter protection protein MgtU [Pantoea sp.]MDU7866814.1 magnesium transporter protection protein MgtU [Pantoea sp.]
MMKNGRIDKVFIGVMLIGVVLIMLTVILR